MLRKKSNDVEVLQVLSKLEEDTLRDTPEMLCMVKADIIEVYRDTFHVRVTVATCRGHRYTDYAMNRGTLALTLK